MKETNDNTSSYYGGVPSGETTKNFAKLEDFGNFMFKDPSIKSGSSITINIDTTIFPTLEEIEKIVMNAFKKRGINVHKKRE